jgi:putative PEP-CTERM system histidine kinase
MSTVLLWSYGAATAAYAALSAFLLVGREPERRGQWVLVALAGTAIWGLAIAVIGALAVDEGAQPRFALIPDALRSALWILCLIVALPGRTGGRNVKGIISLCAVALAGATILLSLVTPTADYANLTLLALSILGCLTVEQLLRNSTAEQRTAVKLFLQTIAGILIYDVFVFSDAMLFKALDVRLWLPRGFLAAAAVPLFLLSAKRHPDWSKTLYISRDVVFYSATLTGVGIYLIAMAVGGFIIRQAGGEWGGGIQLAYLVAALAVLGFVLSSARLKTQLRVFISKHFYRNRYDYRDEWLRLTRTLSDSTQDLPLEQRTVKALCSIVDSDGGQLWLDTHGQGRFEPFGAWQAPFPTQELNESSALVRFLSGTQWVVDTRQYVRDPEIYQHAFRDDPSALMPNSLVFPLMLENTLLGIVRLSCSENLRELNYEDHDLLKTAGRQVAAFLAHDLTREQLSETRQFDAYNKLSAFVMHDLKNLLAQQALLVDNARKFKDRPEFVADVITTVDSGVQRMRKLLRQLEQGAPRAQDQRVELNKLVLRAVSACSDGGKAPCSFVDRAPVWIRAHPEQLTSVLAHVIQNAQEATGGGGRVAVTLDEAADGRALLEVRDDGEGMTEEFIRRRLFKPFETTKGSAGMGIGAYQAREVVRGLGGEMTVTSEVGRGTVVRMFFPQARSAA